MSAAGPLRNALAQAQALVEVRRYAEAIRVLSQLLASEPNHSRAQCLLAQCHLGLGDPAAGLTTANAAVASDPTNEWAHRLRSISALRLKDRRTALESAKEAVRIAPNQTHGYVVLTDAELANRHLAAAGEAAAKARELAPEMPGGHLSMGLVALRRRRPAEAEQHFRDALRCDPENSTAMNNLGVALQRQGRKAQAIHYFAESSRLDPHQSRSRRNAIAAAGTGVSAVAAVAAVQAAGAFQSGLVEAGVMAVAIAVVLPRVIRRVKAGPASRTPHDDPVASKELIRQLRAEAGGGVGVRPMWLVRAVGVFVAFLVGVPLLITGLAEATSANQRSIADIAYVVIGAAFTWLAIWLLRAIRRGS